MNLAERFRKIILANELDNSTAHIYRFSDPDGIRSGKSGWSFAICQFDINNNPRSILCLQACGFTTDEIAGLKAQTIADMAPMHAKLKAAATVVDTWGNAQLQECLTHATHLLTASAISFDESGLLACADYHNQFYMSKGGKLHRHLDTLHKIINAEDILAFKLTLPWGNKRPDDVRRRHQNIVRILRQP